MQSLLKNLTIVSIIGLSQLISAMDSDQKKQADLGIVTQFEREQESKKKSAQANEQAANNALIAEFQKEDQTGLQLEEMQLIAQDEENGQAIRTWLAAHGQDKHGVKLEKLAALPLPILHSVVEFHYGDPQKLRFIAQNMEKFIPAVIEWDFAIFERINSVKAGILAGQKTAMAKRSFTYFDGESHINPSNVFAIAQEPNSFALYGYPNGTIIFKVCPSKFKLLEALSLQQLQFLASLFDLNKTTAEAVNQQINGTTVRVALSQEQQKMYAGLPKEIRDCLDANYGEEDIDIMPLEMAVRIRPNRSAQDQQLIADMLGQNGDRGQNANQ